MIVAQNINKFYGTLQVLKNVSLQINKAEVVAIVGASGAGKTTLLQLIGTLDKPSDGKISINNTDVAALSDKKLSTFRNKNIGFVFQFHHLLPEFTAIENVCLPALIAGVSKKEATQKASELLNLLGVSHRIDHKPNELSGGEQQRVAVARALINDPSVILADEPSGNLDTNNAHELHKLFFTLREKLQQTFVIVTHNKDLADMSDRQLLMKDGIMQ
ncbi:MAG TPA: ABC transporter ATP-binding protein [Bacteroidia bacterium]|jgi:lipoprotein-releasing system ATP-binding protein|nr:ABC transporter ATP-binding protein [Bacteroidia bacterium]